MYTSMGQVVLKVGERVEMGVVRGPDIQWAPRLEEMLAHKGDPWVWQNATVLREDVGIEARFYVLHRDGLPLANIMTAERAGVGIFGHVWTQPRDRRQGAASAVMERQMADFRRRGGRALFLGTGFDSPAYHIYRRFGFESIAAGSGQMACYTTSGEQFDSEYFAPAPSEIQELDWRHWPASPALFMGPFPGAVRCAPLQLVGRRSTEGSLLPLIRSERARRSGGDDVSPRALALVNTATTAVLGLAVRRAHSLWPETELVDVYCHPDAWPAAGDLLAGVLSGAAAWCVAYTDAACGAKADVLSAAGFVEAARLAQWLAVDQTDSTRLDVTVWQKGR